MSRHPTREENTTMEIQKLTLDAVRLGDRVAFRPTLWTRIVAWFRPCPPCYFYRELLSENAAINGDPARWDVNVGGYPIVNVVIQLRGNPGQHYHIQLRHFHAPLTAGTVTFTFALDQGNLPPGGFAIREFGDLRLLMPEFDIIVYSNDGPLDVVAATVYATGA
jgi:hypothetical protein